MAGRSESESGQSLIIVVLAMTLIVALAAFSIDVAQWQVGRHKAQVAADATALAAANCLASLKCKAYKTDGGAEAEQKGKAIAADNGYGDVTLGVTDKAVTAKVKSSVSSSFAGLFGLPSETVSASAVAAYTTGVNAPTSVFGADCSNPTNPPTSGCAVNCATPGVTIDTQGNTTISGAIETNGYVSISITGSDSIGSVESGPGAGTTCGTNYKSVSGNASIANGPADATGFTSFPTTYSSVWTSATNNECSPSSTYTTSPYTGYKNVSASGGTSTVPSTITFGKNNATIGSSTTPVVMCASSSITISGNSDTLNDVTLVAPSISITGNSFVITPDPNALPDGGGSPAVALYQTSATNTLTIPSNGVTVTGAVYAPLVEIDVKGNNGGTALFEGNTVTIEGNNAGDGPPTQLTAFPGSDQLTQ